MKAFKRIMSTAVATTTLLTGMSFPVSATTYDNCDVNKDGVVNTRDVSAVSRYLAGNVYVPNYNQMDADKNLVVNSMDEQRVLAKVMGYSYSSSYYSKKNKTTSNAPTVSEFVSSADDSSTAGRVYKRYDYKNKKQLSNYTLYPSTTQLTSSVQSRGVDGVIGTDNRYLSTGSENTGLVYIKMDDGTYGTGFIVGDHQIATAAHNVYDGGWLTPKTICNYKYNGEMSNNEFTPVEVHIPNDYVPSDGSALQIALSAKWDYALITVEEDLSGYVQFDLGTSYSVDATNFNNIPIHVTGCPEKTPTGANNTSERLYTGEGRIIKEFEVDYNGISGTVPAPNTIVLSFNTDTSHGTSGGPVYTITKNNVNNQASYTYTAIAVNNVGYGNEANFGALMTKYLTQFYKNNSYANY